MTVGSILGQPRGSLSTITIIIMSSERPSIHDPTDKAVESFAENLSHLSRPPTTPSIDVDQPMATTDTGHNSLHNAITHISSGAYSPMSAFQGAHDVRLHHPTITMANSIQYMFNTGGNDQSRSRILASLRDNLLPRAHFAEYDAASPAPRNACTENTREAILNTLRGWASDSTATKVYWLNGMAGTGKTTIAYSFSEILDENGSLGGTFFASHLRVDTSDVRCIIPTISLQLAKYLPSLTLHILDAVEANPDCSSWKITKQFLNFIIRPLTAANRGAIEGVVPVIVLDALDECSDQSLVTELISVILKHSKSLPVKFFITSRPEIVLKETFDDSLGYSKFILHEVEKEIVKADIELYIKACLLGGQIKHDRHHWPPQAELESLVNMSGTLFIYAATVCKYITQKGKSSIPRRFSDVVSCTLEMTSGLTHPLDVLYERILDVAYASTNHKERLDIDMVLTAVVYAYNPLSMTAISSLMQMPIEHSAAAFSSLHSLIYIPSQDPDTPISIFHVSFPDFISKKSLSSKHYLDPCVSHKHLALQCLCLMNKEWSQEERIPYLAERKCEDISESLAYACDSWAFHFTHGDNNKGSDEVKGFFQRHLLRWMDCLSILGKLGTAMDSLHALNNWANTQKVLLITVLDAERFLKENFDFIKSNSVEGCPSALVWLPENSDIWKTYASKMDCPWKMCLGRRKAWSLCEAVLKHSESVESAVFSPDGMHIVTASDDHTACIWNAATGECEAELVGHSEAVTSAVFSPDGRHVVSASDDYTACIWNTATGECEAELTGHSNWVTSAVFSPDGMYIVSASSDHTACVWDIATGGCRAKLIGHSKAVTSAVFSSSGMNVVSSSLDHTARIWNAGTGECETKLIGHSGPVRSAVFSSDDIYILSASDDHTACIWNTATGECKEELRGHLGPVRSAVFSPDGMHIVTSSIDHTARIWNMATGECEIKLIGHSGPVRSAVFSPDGMYIASASIDCSALIWIAATGECITELKGHSGGVISAVFSPDSMHIVSASYDHTAWIWRTAMGECEAQLKGHSNWVRSAVFSPDGVHIVCASDDHTARIWNTATGECEAELIGHSNWVTSAVFSPDGMYIVSASDDHTARIWNTATGDCKAELIGHSKPVRCVVFSPDGMYVVSTSYDHTARIWNTVTGECEAELIGHSNWVTSAVFSPDSMHIVSASNDHTVRIWNTATGDCKTELKGHSQAISSAVFSPDGMHIVSASGDNTARIWNVITGECEAELIGHLKPLISAVFSSDGIYIVSVSYDHTARIWNTATGECKAKLKRHLDSIISAVSPSDVIHVVFAPDNYTTVVQNIAIGGVSEQQTPVLSLSDKAKLGLPSSISDGIIIDSGSYGQIHLSSQLSFLNIHKGTIFHIKNLQKTWIPPLFCKPYCVSHHLSKICLGYASGELVVLEFLD